MRIFWHWLRYVLAVFAAFLVGAIAWVGWLLSGQRYQTFLTEQLSALFEARVQVERSHLSWSSGLGLQLDSISVRDEGSDAPFFVAAGVEVLLDLAALWRGELLFHRVDFVRPYLQIDLAGERFLQLLRRMRETGGDGDTSGSWMTLEVKPTFAVRELRLRDAEISYKKTEESTPLLMGGTAASLVFSENAGSTLVLRTFLKNGSDDIGQVVLHATTAQEVDFATLLQNKWNGEVELSNIRLQELGKIFNERWPSLRFGAKGHVQGAGEGPITFAGVLNASEAQVGAVRLLDVELQTRRAQWGGLLKESWLRALDLEAKITRLRGEIGNDASVLSVSEGELTLQRDNLSLTGLRGAYGKASRFTEATVSFRNGLAKAGPQLEARITADLDLDDDFPHLLTALTPTRTEAISQVLSLMGGRALAQVQVRRANARSLPVYEGSVTFQGARAYIPSWKLDVKELNGVVQVNANVLFSDGLTLKVGESSLRAQGRVTDFLSSQRSGEVQLNLSAVRDYDIASFLPPGKMIPQGGFVDGDTNLAVASLQESPKLTGKLKLTRIRLDLLDFLKPFEVVAGELTLTGQGGSFSVERGQFPGGAFEGKGQIVSWNPLRLELSGDFPELDFGAALALDKPDDGQPKDATRDVKASLTSRRMVYKSAQVDNLKLFCHWHDRQADLRIEHMDVAEGKVHGDVMLWPDIDAAFLQPHLMQVDVERFFRALGVSSKAVSGTLNGEGQIYMPQWGQWDELASWKGSFSLAVVNGVAQRLPILVRLWSILSMQGLLQLQLPSLPIGGFPFTSLTGGFDVGEGLAVTKNLSLIGDSVRIDTGGQIDLKQRSLDLKTALVPLHGITRNMAKVPLAGKLLAQGTDYLTTLNFRVSGTYGDPSVTPLLP